MTTSIQFGDNIHYIHCREFGTPLANSWVQLAQLGPFWLDGGFVRFDDGSGLRQSRVFPTAIYDRDFI